MADMWDDENLPSQKASLLNRGRMETYGHPYDSHKLIATLWSGYLGQQLAVEDVSTMMILLKVAREKAGGFDFDYVDNVDDICGFANTLYAVKEVRRAATDPAAGGESGVGEAELSERRHARSAARRGRRDWRVVSPLPQADTGHSRGGYSPQGGDD